MGGKLCKLESRMILHRPDTVGHDIPDSLQSQEHGVSNLAHLRICHCAFPVPLWMSTVLLPFLVLLQRPSLSFERERVSATGQGDSFFWNLSLRPSKAASTFFRPLVATGNGTSKGTSTSTI